MSALPCLPFHEKDVAGRVKIVLPRNDLLELYNENYELVAVFDEIKRELRQGKAIAGLKGYFELAN